MPDPHVTAVFDFIFQYVIPLLAGLIPIIGVWIMNYNIVFWNEPVRDHWGDVPRPAGYVRTKFDIFFDKVGRFGSIVLGGMFWLLYTLVISMFIVLALGLATKPIERTISPDGIFIFCVSYLLYGGYPFYLSRRDAKADLAKMHGGE